jgi:putative transposase
MRCPNCESATTTERPDHTELGYRRFRCRARQCGFNERTGTLYNVGLGRTKVPKVS